MSKSFVDQCKKVYIDRIQTEWWDHIIMEFIASVKIIYQTPPAAGLRGRAITTAQYKMPELQHLRDFHELMLATPDFTIDIVARGLRQSLLCQCCSGIIDFDLDEPPIDTSTKCDEIWDWIDYGEQQDWKDYSCKVCGALGT